MMSRAGAGLEQCADDLAMKVLVSGATGNIGSKLIPRLVAAGHAVSCMARQPICLERYQWQGVEIHQADVLDLPSLSKVMQGIEVAYYLIHSMADGVKGYIEQDIKAAENFSRSARQAGVQRIIYLGGLGVCEHDLTSHLASRQRVGEILRASGVPVTEFRSAVIIGTGSASFEIIRYLMERIPLLLAPPSIQTYCQPIGVENVLEYLTACLLAPHSINKLYEIGGPDILSYQEMLREYAVIRKLKRKMVRIPGLSPKHAARIMHLFTPIPIAYAEPLLDGLGSEVIVRDPSAQEDFKINLTRYAFSLRQALQRTGSGEVEHYWRGNHPGLEPGVTHLDIEGMFIEQRRTTSSARPEMLFTAFAGIGGRHGWYYANWLWKLRGWVDKLAGGMSRPASRTNPDELHPGDILEGWSVEKVEPGYLIRLKFEMKAPGPAWMQFEAQAYKDGGSLLILTSFFEPHGIGGLIYWYCLYPFHQWINKGLSKAIVRQAEDISHTSDASSSNLGKTNNNIEANFIENNGRNPY